MRYLWKEWRDHRAVLVGFAVAIPALLITAGLALPTRAIRDLLFPSTAFAASFAIAVLALVGDIVPGEARRGRLDFLRRLPRGLTAPFLAKVAFLAVAVPACAAYGWLCAGLVSRIFAGGGFALHPNLFEFAPWVFAAAVWVFVLSTWLPRGALALPGTALLLAGLALPVYLIVADNPGMWDGIPEWYAWLLAGAGGFVAWLSFARGRLFGRGVYAGAWRGLVATLVLVLAPAWAATAREATRWRTLDPVVEPIRIVDGYASDGAYARYVRNSVGPDGRLAFLNVRRDAPRSPLHAFVVDLETGACREAGGPGDWFGTLYPYRPWWYGSREPTSVVALYDCAATPRPEESRRSPQRYWVHYLDAATGERFKSGWSDLRLADVAARVPHTDIEVPGDLRAWNRCGLGWLVVDDKRSLHGYYDPFRQRVYPPEPLREAGLHSFTIRPGRWLAHRHAGHGLWLVDPDTMETEPAGLDRQGVVTLLDDGRVLVVDLDTREPALLDPDTGERRGLEVRTWSKGVGVAALARTPRGRHVLRIRTDDATRIARLDAKTGEVVYAESLDASHATLLAVLDEETILCIREEHQVVRARFGSDDVAVLWPRTR